MAQHADFIRSSDLKNLSVEGNLVDFINKNCASAEDVNYLLQCFRQKLRNLQKISSDAENSVANESGSLDSSNLSNSFFENDESIHKLRDIFTNSQERLAELRKLKEERANVLEQIKEHKNRTEQLFSSLDRDSKRLKQMEKERNEILVLQAFKQKIDLIEQLSQDAVPKAILHYSEAVLIYSDLPEDCNENLEVYMFSNINKWEASLIESVKSEFLRVMSKLGWGSGNLVADSSSVKGSEKETLISHRNELFIQLLGLQKPLRKKDKLADDDTESLVSNENQDTSGAVRSFQKGNVSLSPPITALLVPYKKKFFFHFSGDRKTNKLEKPEWYLTQVLKWLQETKDYLDAEFQPLMKKVSNQPDSVKIMFAKGLLSFIKTKLSSDLPLMVHNEVLLCHYIDEILNFDKEFGKLLDFINPNNCFYDPVQILLLDESLFPKWLAMESNLVKEKLDTLLSDTQTCWKPEISDEPSFKFIPKSADVFLTMLDCITNRYSSVPSLDHKRQFFFLQLELLDEFQTRLMQLKNQQKCLPIRNGVVIVIHIESFCGIVNSALFVKQVLKEWSCNVSYTLLSLPAAAATQTFPMDGSSDGTLDLALQNTVPFGYQIETFSLLVQDCENVIASYVADQLKERVDIYQSQRFWTKSTEKVAKEKQKGGDTFSDQTTVTVSGIGADIFLLLANVLDSVSSSLNPSSFRNVWHKTCRLIDKILFTDLVMRTKFSQHGCSQLLTDIKEGLWSIIGGYTRSPANFFPHLADVCHLFSLGQGTAMLLRDHLETLQTTSTLDHSSTSELQSILEEHNLAIVNTEIQLLQILSKRLD